MREQTLMMCVDGEMLTVAVCACVVRFLPDFRSELLYDTCFASVHREIMNSGCSDLQPEVCVQVGL